WCPSGNMSVHHFFFSSRRRHTRWPRDWSSDVCSSDLFRMTTETLDSVLLQTDFRDLELFASGKVRDVYQIGSDHLLFIATDRISAFDYVLATGIPHKGQVLTQISLFWFDFLKELVPNHLVTANVSSYPAEVQKYADP